MSSEDVVDIVDIEVARAKMKKWRDEGYRNSDEIIDLGECLLMEHASKLGNEIWVVYEQVCIAALDFCRLDLAEECIKALRKQFPNSTRVYRLTGMLYEADQNYEGAQQIYDRVLEDDPANLPIRKRKIAILKAQNLFIETITEMNKYLADFMGDQDAWMELSDLYIGQCDYPKAAFCLEELILQQPHNHLFHQRYAEVHYTIGTQDSIEKARKYFAMALKLDPSNTRALYGLFLSSSMNPNKSSSRRNPNINAKMSEWSAQQIYDMFEENVSEGQRKTLDELFDKLQLQLPSSVPE